MSIMPTRKNLILLPLTYFTRWLPCFPAVVVILVLLAPWPVQGNPYRLVAGQESLYFLSGISLLYLGDEKDNRPTAQEIGELDKSDVPYYDRPYAGASNQTAEIESDILLLAGVTVPGGLLCLDNTNIKTLSVMYLEVLVLTYGGVVYAKGLNTRFRPYAYSDESSAETRDRDVKQSFFSGHAALITAASVFSATVYSDHFPHSNHCSAVWASAIGISVYGSWARVRAGKHFPSDVLAGLVWGGLVGYAVPALHRKTVSHHPNWRLVPYLTHERQVLSFLYTF